MSDDYPKRGSKPKSFFQRFSALFDSEPETPESSYAPRKQAQQVKSGALNDPARGQPSDFEKAPSGTISVRVGYDKWPTEKLEAQMTEMLSRLKSKGMSAADLTGEGKSKFEAVQQELTRRGSKQ